VLGHLRELADVPKFVGLAELAVADRPGEVVRKFVEV